MSSWGIRASLRARDIIARNVGGPGWGGFHCHLLGGMMGLTAQVSDWGHLERPIGRLVGPGEVDLLGSPPGALVMGVGYKSHATRSQVRVEHLALGEFDPYPGRGPRCSGT